MVLKNKPNTTLSLTQKTTLGQRPILENHTLIHLFISRFVLCHTIHVRNYCVALFRQQFQIIPNSSLIKGIFVIKYSVEIYICFDLELFTSIDMCIAIASHHKAEVTAGILDSYLVSCMVK